jgi:UDP-3-O-[3-hydroxymyristoyl] glucosamine N-acyltransferase
MKPTLLIFGDKTANEILEAAQLTGPTVFASIQKRYFDPSSFESELVPQIRKDSGEVFFHAGVADVELKRTMVQKCLEQGWKPFTVVHPSAVISPSAKLGVGVFIAPLAVISSNAIVGKYGIVHIHASIGHDAMIGEYSAILPGARISGSVTIGDRVLVGSNAVVGAGIKIGDDCQVDALTYVPRDLEAKHILSVRAKGPLKRIPNINEMSN